MKTYRNLKVVFGSKEFNISLGYRLTEDFVAGIITGFYLVLSFLKFKQVSVGSINAILTDEDSGDVEVRFEGDNPPYFLNKFIEAIGEDVTPAHGRAVQGDIVFIYWVLCDINNGKFILFRFNNSDFIRGIIAITASYGLEVKDIMYSYPFYKAVNWNNISLTVKNQDRDLLYFKGDEKENIPYMPYTKDVGYCDEKTNQLYTEQFNNSIKEDEGILAKIRGFIEDLNSN